MKLAELEAMLADDLEVDEDSLVAASLSTPTLHSKWMKFSTDEIYKLNILTQRMAKLKKAKWEYYQNKASPKVYESRPFNLKLTKGELPLYIEADDDIQVLQRQLWQKEALVNRLGEAVKTIQFRHTNIKNAIEWTKFRHGAT